MAARFTAATPDYYNSTSYTPTTGDLTIEFWHYAYTDDSDAPVPYITKNSGGAQGDFSVQILPHWNNAGNKYLLQYRVGAGATALQSSANLATDTWYYSRISMRTSDGAWNIKTWNTSWTEQGSGSGTSTTGARNATDGFFIARRNQGGTNSYWNGRARNVLFFESYSTDDEASRARAFSNNPVREAPGTLVFFTPLVDSTDNRVMSNSSILSMTKNGTPSTEDDVPVLTKRY